MNERGHRASAARAAAMAIMAMGTAGIGAATGTAADAGAASGSFKLESSVVAPNSTLGNDQVFSGFGCSGKNISPPLSWSGAPAGTKSFALTVFDPDAPTGSGWWHWVVYNIPASVSELAQGAGNSGGKLPPGAMQGRTDFGNPGYGGPCPPAGSKPHHYVFTLYALKIEKIEVPEGASPALIGFNIRSNSLGTATLTGMYARAR
jgi:Raf kinase inhibitor-like YbhB/YbcL family protein